MNMSPTNKMNSCALNMSSADETKNAFSLSTRGAAASAINPRMLKLLSHSRTTNKMSQESLIDQALEIVSSPDSTFNTSISGGQRGYVTRRRYSFRSKSGCPIRQRELLTDNTDRLQELIMRAFYNTTADVDSDYDSDLED